MVYMKQKIHSSDCMQLPEADSTDSSHCLRLGADLYSSGINHTPCPGSTLENPHHPNGQAEPLSN